MLLLFPVLSETSGLTLSELVWATSTGLYHYFLFRLPVLSIVVIAVVSASQEMWFLVFDKVLCDSFTTWIWEFGFIHIAVYMFLNLINAIHGTDIEC